VPNTKSASVPSVMRMRPDPLWPPRIASCNHETSPSVTAKNLGVDGHALREGIVRSRTRQLAIGGLKCAAGQACRGSPAQDLTVLTDHGDRQGEEQPPNTAHSATIPTTRIFADPPSRRHPSATGGRGQ
jgi:hypothetical protein